MFRKLLHFRLTSIYLEITIARALPRGYTETRASEHFQTKIKSTDLKHGLPDSVRAVPLTVIDISRNVPFSSSAFSQLFRFPDAAVHCSPPEGNMVLSIRNGIGTRLLEILFYFNPLTFNKQQQKFVDVYMATFITCLGHAVKLALHEVYGGEYATKGWKAFAEQVSKM